MRALRSLSCGSFTRIICGDGCRAGYSVRGRTDSAKGLQSGLPSNGTRTVVMLHCSLLRSREPSVRYSPGQACSRVVGEGAHSQSRCSVTGTACCDIDQTGEIWNLKGVEPTRGTRKRGRCRIAGTPSGRPVHPIGRLLEERIGVMFIRLDQSGQRARGPPTFSVE